MGEAKRRQEKDSFYGRRAKVGKGIVVSQPVRISPAGDLNVSGGGVDPIELRRAVLFWDRINKPTNNFIRFELNSDEEFLKSCGILREYAVQSGSISGPAGMVYADMHLSAFNSLEAQEPGLWTLSEGENSFQLTQQGRFKEGRGAIVELHRAIPLPDATVPLHDLLEFKNKRRDELLTLSLELDGLFSRIAASPDSEYELQRAIMEVDQRCADVISVGKESKLRFSLSDISYGASLELNSTNLLASSLLGGFLGSTIGLPQAGAALGAAASTIKFNVGIGGKLSRSSRSASIALSPYRVVASLINEPI